MLEERTSNHSYLLQAVSQTRLEKTLLRKLERLVWTWFETELRLGGVEMQASGDAPLPNLHLRLRGPFGECQIVITSIRVLVSRYLAAEGYRQVPADRDGADRAWCLPPVTAEIRAANHLEMVARRKEEQRGKR